MPHQNIKLCQHVHQQHYGAVLLRFCSWIEEATSYFGSVKARHENLQVLKQSPKVYSTQKVRELHSNQRGSHATPEELTSILKKSIKKSIFFCK